MRIKDSKTITEPESGQIVVSVIGSHYHYPSFIAVKKCSFICFNSFYFLFHFNYLLIFVFLFFVSFSWRFSDYYFLIIIWSGFFHGESQPLMSISLSSTDMRMTKTCPFSHVFI